MCTCKKVCFIHLSILLILLCLLLNEDIFFVRNVMFS